MDFGWTGWTFRQSPVDQQDLFKQQKMRQSLVDQGARARRENATDHWAGSTAQMMMEKI